MAPANQAVRHISQQLAVGRYVDWVAFSSVDAAVLILRRNQTTAATKNPGSNFFGCARPTHDFSPHLGGFVKNI